MTEALIRQHKLSDDEYARIVSAIGREPTFTELGVFSVMYSEHCSYKSSRRHLRRLPTTGARVIQGPGENAGVVDIGDGFAAVFKMESHNHPSFIEPYQGAATGVGGILRDVFTMGARPIALLNALRFGAADHKRTPELLRGVVAGIGGYGNCIGVPTVGGDLQFDARYDGNILVNAFACGVARTDAIFYGKASGVGNAILYIGAKTGRDGIHGATMASDEFSNDGPANRPTMQVGDPFVGKLLLEACLELFQSGAVEGIQDMGAAGLTSSSVEMGGRAATGVEIDLDAVPRRAKRMAPYEILLSESQERMLLVAKPGAEETVATICKKWELDSAIIGRVTNTQRWVVLATPNYDPLSDPPSKRKPQLVCDLPLDALTEGAPAYDRPRATDVTVFHRARIEEGDVPIPADWGAELLRQLGSSNVGSREWVWRQYDHVVRGGTLVRPGSDAAVVRVPCERDGQTIDKFLAFSVDCNGRHCELSAYEGGAMAVAEVCRNLVCSGAQPIGLTDCLNFGNPERPEIMDQLASAIDGIAAACRALGVPVVSGNVSLYNETDGRAILPTPMIAAVGLLKSEHDIVTSWFKGAGDVVLLLGEPTSGTRGLAGSDYLSSHVGRVAAVGGKHPRIDLDAEAALQSLVLGLAREQRLVSAHDVSGGGLAVALAECCVSGPIWSGDFGARVDLDLSIDRGRLDLTALLFGEDPSRVIISVRRDDVALVKDRAVRAGVPVNQIGVTGGHSLSIGFVDESAAAQAAIRLELSDVRRARSKCLESIVGAA